MKYRRPPLRAELSSAAVHSLSLCCEDWHELYDTVLRCAVMYSGTPRVCHYLKQHCVRARNCIGRADEETHSAEDAERGWDWGRDGTGQDRIGRATGGLYGVETSVFVFNQMQNTKW